MKKIIAILLCLLMISVSLIGCSKKDGKCDECGEKAYELTEEDKEYMEMLGIEYEDELCEEHFEEEMMSQLMSNPLIFGVASNLHAKDPASMLVPELD